MKPAFSTIATPDWTLSQVARAAEHSGALGVELRSFGRGSTRWACDPALTGAEKFRAIFDRVGVIPFCLATSVRFDAPIFPPVLGRVFSDIELSVREGKSAVDLARELGIPFVRVFAFELHGDESRAGSMARIMERLSKVVDHCRNTGVRLLLENGGSFPTATDIAELIDLCASPMVMAAYSPAVAAAAGERAAAGLNVLGDRLASVKLRDLRQGRPCAIGAGDLGAGEVIDALRTDGYDGWVVAELDYQWLPAGVAPDVGAAIDQSVRFIYERMGSSRERAAPRQGARAS